MINYKILDYTSIVNIMVPGVWGFINKASKEAYISYSTCVCESIVRMLKRGGNKYDSWEPIIIVTASGDLNELKFKFVEVCNELEKEEYKIINRKISYKLKGRIEQDYRVNPPPYKYLYYVWLCTKNYRIEPLGVFEKALDGEKYLKELKDNNSYKAFDNELTNEYRKIWKDLDYKKAFKK